VHRERGAVTPLMIAAVFLMGVFVMVLGRLGVATVSQAQARTAADAAALAGAAEGREAAVAIAEANGAKLEQFEAMGADTRVTVRVGEARATARARRGGSDTTMERGGVDRRDRH
jgi:putative Flp pilus-assembly TadE/G-like protein